MKKQLLITSVSAFALTIALTSSGALAGPPVPATLLAVPVLFNAAAHADDAAKDGLDKAWGHPAGQKTIPTRPGIYTLEGGSLGIDVKGSSFAEAEFSQPISIEGRNPTIITGGFMAPPAFVNEKKTDIKGTVNIAGTNLKIDATLDLIPPTSSDLWSPTDKRIDPPKSNVQSGGVLKEIKEMDAQRAPLDVLTNQTLESSAKNGKPLVILAEDVEGSRMSMEEVDARQKELVIEGLPYVTPDLKHVMIGHTFGGTVSGMTEKKIEVHNDDEPFGLTVLALAKEKNLTKDILHEPTPLKKTADGETGHFSENNVQNKTFLPFEEIEPAVLTGGNEEERLAKLAGGVAKINVGAATEVGMRIVKIQHAGVADEHPLGFKAGAGAPDALPVALGEGPPPAADDRRKEMLEDMAVLTGGQKKIIKEPPDGFLFAHGDVVPLAHEDPAGGIGDKIGTLVIPPANINAGLTEAKIPVGVTLKGIEFPPAPPSVSAGDTENLHEEVTIKPEKPKPQ